MFFRDLPTTAAWQHLDARTGFEVVYFETLTDGLRVHGCTTALEEGETWIVGYMLEVDHGWHTRLARVSSRSGLGHRKTSLAVDSAGRWRVDGQAAPHLDGCRDVDLEASAMTNALPVHRLRLAVGAKADAPAAYVRATDLSVERLEQTYVRAGDETGRQRYDYAAPVFDFDCRLAYDTSGLILDYPGIAVRAG